MTQIHLFLKCYFSALLLYSSMVLLTYHLDSFGSIVDSEVSRTKNGLCRFVTSAQINSTLGRLHCLHFQLSSNTAGRVIIIHQGAADTRFKKLCWRRVGLLSRNGNWTGGKYTLLYLYTKVNKRFKCFSCSLFLSRACGHFIIKQSPSSLKYLGVQWREDWTVYKVFYCKYFKCYSILMIKVKTKWPKK